MPVYNYTILDNPSSVGFTTNVEGINSAGQVVGFYGNNSGEHGFLYSSGTYITIDDPLATGLIQAVGINDTGPTPIRPFPRRGPTGVHRTRFPDSTKSSKRGLLKLFYFHSPDCLSQTRDKR